MFRSDWLLDDPIEVITDLEKKLVSTAEIDSLSTNENLSDIDKALYLLDKGQISQKVWVVKNISAWMKKPNFQLVVAELIDRIPYWTETAQEEAGKSFKEVLENECFPVKYYENLLLLITQIIENETWSFQETWGEVFAELAKRYPKKCLAEALPLTAFSQTDNNRLVGGYVLSAVVVAQKGENCEDLIKKIFAIAQDPSSKVRKTMCKALRLLTQVLPKKRVESQVVSEVLKLVEDDSDEVLESSLPLFCELMEFCSYQYKEVVIETMKASFFTSQVNKLGHVKLKYFGRVLVSLRLCIDEEFRNLSVCWFQGFQQVKEEGIQELMVYNFPALVYIVGSITDPLFQVFRYLESIQNWDVRKILALELRNIIQYSNGKENELLKIVKGFIDDSKTFPMLLGSIFQIGKSLKDFEYFGDVLVLKLSLNTSDWRLKVGILKELCDFVNTSNCKHLEQLFSLTLELIQSNCKPVRFNSAKLLAEVFYKSLQKHEEYVYKIVSVLAKSESCHLRISFIKFCVHLIPLSSHKFFYKTFYPTLTDLSKDRVKDVLYEFAQNLLAFRLSLPFGDLEAPSEFRRLTNFFLGTGDAYLAELVFSYDEQLDSLVSQHYSSSNEAKENSKIKYEDEAVFQEIAEFKPPPKAKPRKSTLAPRGSSVNPVKRFSLIEIDRPGLDRVIQKTVNKKKGVK